MSTFPVTSFSQIKANGTSSAAATIVTPVTISNTGQMNFGNIPVDAASCTLVLDPAGSKINTSDITLSDVNTGTVSAAVFVVSGGKSYIYSITLPSSDYTVTDTHGEIIIINSFTSNPTVTGLLTGGTQTLKVGATLNIRSSQTAGIYTNKTGFDVIVNYN